MQNGHRNLIPAAVFEWLDGSFLSEQGLSP
jgi:hypothetical protein